MSLFHGLEETRKIKVGDGSIYVQTRKYCAAHGWIIIFTSEDKDKWEKNHGECVIVESHDLQLKPSLKKAA